MKCKVCKYEMKESELKMIHYICPNCGRYLRISAKRRLKMVLDEGSFHEWFSDLKTKNVLDFEGYEEKIDATVEKTGISEAVVVGKGTVNGEKICIGVCDASFLMGSMGRVVGERITRAIERATEEKLPVFMFCCSGGARMQEGIVSLMQMEKTSAAIAKHDAAGGFYCSILTDPTTGGVTASFAMLGDVILAEPGALVGFAGRRVIEQALGETLPDDFQTAEFQLEHGMVDYIVQRHELKDVIYKLAYMHRKDNTYKKFKAKKEGLFSKIAKIKLKKDYPVKTPWEKVKHVRDVKHPSAVDYMELLFTDFMELHGDRVYGDDKAIVAGLAYFEGTPVTVVSDVRGNNLNECMERNFGMPNPEGYRKAMRLMKQADKFHRPIISFINTAGAYCGVGAEERGVGEAIARNLFELSKLQVPVLVIVLGEAGSGGALATAVGNKVLMFENATYSILSPEGYASILWKDSQRAEEAASKMKIQASDLKELKVIEGIIPEFGGASKENLKKISREIRLEIVNFLLESKKKSGKELAQERYARFRSM